MSELLNLLVSRILTRTKREGDCLIWLGALNDKGYGVIGVNRRKPYLKKVFKVHRLILEYKLGRPIREGYEPDHTCFNRNCVLADHLQEVTVYVNRTHHR